MMIGPEREQLRAQVPMGEGGIREVELTRKGWDFLFDQLGIPDPDRDDDE